MYGSSQGGFRAEFGHFFADNRFETVTLQNRLDLPATASMCVVMPILTDQFIAALPSANHVQAFYWDEEMKGFGVKVMESGRKIFVVQYRAVDGKARRSVLGDTTMLTLKMARQLAADMIRDAAIGKDRLTERERDRNAPTVRDLCDQYMEKHALLKKKASSAKEDLSLINRNILPVLGSRKVTDVKRSDIAQLHYDLRSTPTHANRVRVLISTMFNLAEKWEWRPDHSNPTRHVDPYPENKRQRYLSMEELTRLSAVLNEAEIRGTEERRVIAAIRLLIFTGCRHGEIMTLKWEYVDFEHHCLRLPDSKTGAKDVQIGESAIEVLESIPRLPDNPYVFHGRLPGKCWTDLQRPWERIRERAGIPDVRIHDLRHTFASIAVNMGESLPMISKLLGHTQLKTTERYAHVAVAPQLAAADRISSTIAEMMAKDRVKLLPASILLLESPAAQ